MSNEQARQQKELDAQEGQLAQNRSLEDYALADTEEDRKIEQAGMLWRRRKKSWISI